MKDGTFDIDGRILRFAHQFLDGVTAGVVGLITATAFSLARIALNGLATWLIFAITLVMLYRWKAKQAVLAAVLIAGLLGLLLR